jgi:hypothetical protein
MRRRVCALAVAGTMVLATAPVAAEEVVVGPIDCPEVRPVGSLSPGDEGQGYTVSRGTEPEPFDVEVVDVLADALAPGIPLILVEVDSPEIDRVGGIWAGMSGSPVYVDGQLIGAVAYGFSFGPSKLGGVTPASAMLAVPGRPTLPPPPGPARVRLPDDVRDLAVTGHGVSRSASGSMQPLRVPVRLSGPTGTKFDQVARAFEREHPGTVVLRGAGSAAAAAPTDIVAGGNIGVSLAYGDYTAVGVGTATTVCGDVVTAFGHPMLYAGATRLGMHGASAVRVVDDPTLGGYKLANVTGPVGTIEQDRLAAVAGRLGVLPPTTAIRTTITDRQTGSTTEGRTDAVLADDLFGAVLSHGWVNFDQRVFDDLYVAGTSQVRWTIRGIRSSGASFAVTRENRHASLDDLSTESLVEVAAAASDLHANPFEEVRITEVDYEATAGSPYTALGIVPGGVTVSIDGGPFRSSEWELELLPGSEVRVRVPLRRHRGATQTVTATLDVPDDAAGYGAITVTGGAVWDDPFECFFDPSACAPEADSFADLLDQLAQRERNDDLVVSLSLYPDEPEEDLDRAPEVVREARRLDDVVTGYAEVPVFVEGDGWNGGGTSCPDEVVSPFVDVDPASPHAASVACAAALGLTTGVAVDPPRFAPARPVTRGQAASFLVRALDLGPMPLPDAGAPRFTDVVGSPHAENIERLAAAGIVRGRTATRFDPQAPVTREQMATLLVGSLSYLVGSPLAAEEGPYFSDVAGVHAGNVDAAFELGLVFGRDDGTFRPSASTRRDQMASLLVRFLDASMVVG